MRIVLMDHNLNIGGAQRQRVVLAKGLMDRGHQVTVVVFYPGGALQEELEQARVPVLTLGKAGRWDMGALGWRLPRLLRRLRPDILYSDRDMPNILGVLLRPLFPGTRVVWGVEDSIEDLSQFPRMTRVLRLMEWRLARFAHLTVANSLTGRDVLTRHGFPGGRTVVISNGIDTQRFKRDRDGRERLRREWNVAAEHRLVGLVGRLDPLKDHPTFLQAAARLARERSDMRFVCVGDGPDGYRAELHSLGAALGLDGRLTWAGMRSDMSAVYSALDALVSASYTEGLSNVILEAMACETPCVVTDVGDSARVVGELGVVVQPRDPEALAKGVQEMLATPPDGETLRASIERHYSMEALLSQTEARLLELLHDRH